MHVRFPQQEIAAKIVAIELRLPSWMKWNPMMTMFCFINLGEFFDWRIILVACSVGVLSSDVTAQESGPLVDSVYEHWEFLDNGNIRIGVDPTRGACIGYFGVSGDERNILNHYDHGRFIQQSYYGDADESDWNGKPWRYNPIQGGSWEGDDARVLEFSVDEDSGLYAKVEPRHWASGEPCPEAIMEQWIKLDGSVAHVRCRLTYEGDDHRAARSQEMPAVFVDSEFKNLVYVEENDLVRRIPGWPNEPGKTSDDWVAYLNDEDWGIGILTPGTSEFTCYRFTGDGKSGPLGSACSYVAPIRSLRLQRGEIIEYDFYLTLGSLEDLHRRFDELHDELQAATNQERERPNIIVVFTDDWGYGDLGAFDNLSDVKTPYLDDLSDRGILFTDAYVTAPQCSPSRAGLMTGQYQQSFGFDTIPDCPLPLSQLTIADRLKQAGYITGMVGKWHLEPNALSLDWAREHQPDGIEGRRVNVRRELAMPYFPQARGFDEFFMGQRRRYWCNFDLDGNDLQREGEFVDDGRFRVNVQTDAALAFIQRNKSQPFFLYLAYYAPHVPLEAPEKYLARFSGEMPERRRTGLAMINAVDEGVGRIMNLLEEEGIGDDTLFMFTSDNGAPLGAHSGRLMADVLPVDQPGPAWDGSRNDPLTGEKGMLAEGGIRVPMIWSWPARLPGGQSFSEPTISLDMTATALAAAGVTDRTSLDGVDLVPLLNGQVNELAERELYWRFWNQAAIRSGDWKYIVTGSGRELLFNLRNDKEERDNLLDEQPEHAARLRSKLSQWADQLQPAGLPSETPNRQEIRWYEYYFGAIEQVP